MVGFVVGYSQQVLVEGFPLEDCLWRLLPATSAICRHTNIVHLQAREGQTHGVRYMWVHPELCPWGNQLPVQCKACGCIRSWVSSTGNAGARIFACQNPQCTNKLIFNAPEEKVWLGGKIFGGCWLVITQN